MNYYNNKNKKQLTIDPNFLCRKIVQNYDYKNNLRQGMLFSRMCGQKAIKINRMFQGIKGDAIIATVILQTKFVSERN